MEENMIRVTGSGTIHVVPDVTRIELSLVSIHDTYEDAYKQAKNDTDKLKKIMEELKLDARIDFEDKMTDPVHGHSIDDGWTEAMYQPIGLDKSSMEPVSQEPDNESAMFEISYGRFEYDMPF